MTILLEWWCYWNGVLYIYRSVIIWRFDLRGSTALFQLLVLNEKTRAIRCISIQISLSFFLEPALSWQLSLSSPLLDTGRFCDFKGQSQTFSLRNVVMFSFPILAEMCRVPLYVSFSASFESRLLASHQENSPEKPLRSSCCHFDCHHHHCFVNCHYLMQN